MDATRDNIKVTFDLHFQHEARLKGKYYLFTKCEKRTKDFFSIVRLKIPIYLILNSCRAINNTIST